MTNGKQALAELVEGLDGVTGGKWCQFHPSFCEEAKGTPFSDWDTSHDLSSVRDGKRTRIATFKHASDAAHVDRMSPDRIRAIAAYVEELERERERLQSALAFWMPGVSEAIEIELNGRAGDDALLLAGFEGDVPQTSWGDQVLARATAAEAKLADAVKALETTRALVSEAALTGFNYQDGDWAERLYANQAVLSAAIRSSTHDS